MKLEWFRDISLIKQRATITKLCLDNNCAADQNNMNRATMKQRGVTEPSNRQTDRRAAARR